MKPDKVTDDELQNITDDPEADMLSTHTINRMAAECLASREEVERLTAELLRAHEQHEADKKVLQRHMDYIDALTAELNALKAERDGLAKWQAQAREVMRVLLSRYSMLNPNIKDRLRKLAGEGAK